MSETYTVNVKPGTEVYVNGVYLGAAPNRIPRFQIPELDTYTKREKEDFFEEAYNFAASHYESVRDDPDHYVDSDIQHYAFELIMEILGKDVWNSYNEMLS